MSERYWFGLIRFDTEWAFIERGSRLRRGWGFVWDGLSYGRLGAWTAPIPFNWVLYWGIRFYFTLMLPRRFDRRYRSRRAP